MEVHIIISNKIRKVAKQRDVIMATSNWGDVKT